MTNLVAVDNKIHQHLKIASKKAELHGAELNLIPVVMVEFINVAVQYPIVFTKNAETGQFVTAAMLGFGPHENLFWQDGCWQGLYLPMQIQRQPFFVGDPKTHDSSKEHNEYVVCIDLDSPTLIANELPDTENESLFTVSGEETPYFQQAKNCLAQLLQGEIDNEKLLSYLQQLDLLQPLSLEITFVNKQSTRLNGLYTINQEKLAGLPPDHLVTLHQAKLLPAIYTMIASLGQIYALIERKNTRLNG